MKTRICKISLRKLYLVVCFMIGLPLSGAVSIFLSASQVQGAGAEDTLWNFSFKDLPVAQVLEKLSQETGIDIFTNQPPKEKRVTKTYENETIEGIIRDVFRGDNYTLVWDYNGSAIQSIGINFFDQGTTGPDRSSGVSRYNRGSQTVDRNSDAEAAPATRRLTRPIRPTPAPVRVGNRPGSTPPKDANEEEQATDEETPDEQNQDEENPDEPDEEVKGSQGENPHPAPPQDEEEQQKDDS